MEALSPLMAILGGLVIGTAAAMLLLINGRIAGVSGMLATATRVGTGGPPWGQAAAFIVGLPLAPCWPRAWCGGLKSLSAHRPPR